jgi:hypothetical protein
MEIKVCVAARDLIALSRIGATRLAPKWPIERAVLVDTIDGAQLWVGTASTLPLDFYQVWNSAFPDRPVPLGHILRPAYDLPTANLRGYLYVRLPLRPPSSVLERWVPLEPYEPDDLLWAIYSSPLHFL